MNAFRFIGRRSLQWTVPKVVVRPFLPFQHRNLASRFPHIRSSAQHDDCIKRYVGELENAWRWEKRSKHQQKLNKKIDNRTK